MGDKLTNNGGNSILCHPVFVKSKKKRLDRNFILSGGLLQIAMGSAVVVEPYQTKNVIPPCKIHGRVRGITSIC